MNEFLKSRQWRLAKRLVVLGLGVYLTLAVTCRPEDISDTFALAYASSSGSPVIVRWSTDAGSTWKAGDYRSTTVGSGLGMMSDRENFLLYITLTDRVNDVYMVWGLGPATWDQSGTSTPSAPPASTPSGVHITGQKWLVAFRRGDGTLFAGVYDHSVRRFVADIAPLGTLSSGVDGRPALAARDGIVALVWRRTNGGIDDLVAAKGTISSAGDVSFDTPQVIPTPAEPGLAAGVQSDPAVGVAAGVFNIIVVREQTGAPLHGWSAVRFTSTDAASWTASGTVPIDVHNQTHLAIAGNPTGLIIAIAIRKISTGTAPPSVARFEGGRWRTLSAAEVSAMFGGSPTWKPFAMLHNR